MNTSRLESIQALRGVAAIMVAVMHGATLSGRGGNWYALQLAAASQTFGYIGVDIFFVISGAIVALMLQREPAGPAASARFVFRRAARIYPAFWIVLGAAFILIVLLRPEKVPHVSTLRELLLLDTSPSVAVSWTLPYELRFYVVVAIAMLFGRRVWLAMGAWIVLQVLAVAASSAGLTPVRFFTPLTFEFIFGLAVGGIGARRVLPYPLFFAAAGFLFPIALNLVFGSLTFAGSAYGRPLAYGVPSALLVWAAISCETAGGQMPRFLTTTGDLSYSLYLWHVPLFAALAAIVPGWLYSGPGVLAFLVAEVLVAGIVSIASFNWIERPINRWAARVGRSSAPAGPFQPAMASPNQESGGRLLGLGLGGGVASRDVAGTEDRERA